MIARAREEYAAGRIGIAELERHIEVGLLREAGPEHRVPDGWDPLPPCQHLWFDFLRVGDVYPREICGRCGDERLDGLWSGAR